MIENKPEPIDFGKIALLLWSKRKFIIKTCIVAFVVAVVYAFSVPRTYSSSVTLAPEIPNSGVMGGFGALADMAGFGFDNSTGDAIYPEIYPELISSKDFLIDLFPVQVVSLDGKINTTLYEYQKKHQKFAWWLYPLVWCKKFVKWVKNETPVVSSGDYVINPFHLSKEEFLLAEAIKANIFCAVDKKTGVITLRYTAQDPLIAATMTNVVKDKIQEHIIDYRTCKARNDLKYFESLCSDAREEYVNAQLVYAKFCDMHKGAQRQSVAMEMARLENDMNLAQAAYSQSSQQLQLTRAKLQENTPAFAVISCASVPLKPSAPRRMFIVFGAVLFAAMGASLYLYFKNQVNGSLQ